ncbi:MAG: hypothetical protein KQJ78_25745 [Deltaproteobacteria bacterium]|nr:hypothetical protein [Deltaproteobacteria bacterium]
MHKKLIMISVIMLLLAACQTNVSEQALSLARATVVAEITSTSAARPTHTATATVTATVTATATPQPTYDPNSTPTLTPTLAYPQATVLQQSNCRYGPGAPYLYEWGLYPEDRVTVTARNELSTWVYVQPRSYSGYCWVKAELLDIDGEIDPLPPFYGRLPYSELYKPPTNPRATREGTEVYLVWDPVWMTADDDRGYLIEAWVCRDNQLVFNPIGTTTYTETSISITDEAGCAQPSGARLYTAEKHGYTQWVQFTWPQAGPGG